MDNEIMQTLTLIVEKLGDMENDIKDTKQELKDTKQELKQELKDTKQELRQKLKQEITKVNLTLENETNKKIDALYDGYMMSIQKNQQVIDRQLNLEKRVDILESKIN